MPTTLLGQKSLSASIEQSVRDRFTQDGTYSRVYIVRADNECNDEYSVLFGTTGLPNIHERSEIYPALRVTSRSASEIAPKVWEVTVTWTLPEQPQSSGGGGGSGGKRFGEDEGLGPAVPERDQTAPGSEDDPPEEKPPWMLPGRVSFDTAKKKVAMTHGYYFGTSENGLPGSDVPKYHRWTKDADKLRVDNSGWFQIPFTNSAGEPFTYDVERVAFTATYEKSVRNIDFGYYQSIIGTVNKNFVKIGDVWFPPLKVLLSDASMSQESWTNPMTGIVEPYWNIKITYEMDPNGHCIHAMDVGSKHYVSYNDGPDTGNLHWRREDHTNQDGYPFVNKAEEFVDGFLNGYGGEDQDGETNFLFYLPHRLSDVDWPNG